ncbi:thioredoxin reductase [Roseivirga spongicola]|jgi:thioredoxin reductase (NADPH)|uniref:Thioredoxin reductase n=1 Tax=Roseivirga spongicola TaxID=333140 RepID=A0A150X4Z9_9BACT|nr:MULTISPECIES: thioredoxin-disulfide reductase [Roseivirga]KYG73786.1 thioredoxin reductase [Roseivirga spongicola]MBO6495868.1 thioredoxin-disulfide reductase [Roseivirga sp.]MBO6660075.1 thioredoxin-disulfide reductase [Roseivirga sp.]MBO6907188.1 thioredoxin-disulfide reductase [Roseivirga sp.]
MATENIKVLIIGSGPAGYTAAIYASRAGLNPVLYTGGEPGGQLTTTNDVENFPGYPEGINGPQMMVDLQKQAERFGTQVRYGLITKVDFSEYPLKVWVDDKVEVTAESVIISTGASAKYLGLESEKTFANKGVSACAVCDGFFYKGKNVAVVGGGDTAAEEATYLANLCPKVYLLVRRDEMRASTIMQERVKNTPNIEVLWHTEAEEVLGDDTGVTGVRVVNNQTKETKDLDISGFFVAIGHKPNTDIFKDYLDMDETGYLKVQPGSTKTNVEGVFATGDAADRIYRQAVTAAGTGCMGALDAERFLAEKEFEVESQKEMA